MSTFPGARIDVNELRTKIVERKQRALALLEEAVRGLEEELESRAIMPAEDGQEYSRNSAPLSRKVFVVHGRDDPLRKSMFDFLRALDLAPYEWHHALEQAKGNNPYVGHVIDEVMDQAQAVVVSRVSQKPELSADTLYLREERPKNLLRWDVTVQPTQNGEKALAVDYSFKLELDRQMQIGTVVTK